MGITVTTVTIVTIVTIPAKTAYLCGFWGVGAW
jgi:hypothetical protein